MIKERMKTKKGISLISLTITVSVLLILTNVILYNVKDNLKIGKLKEMQNDIADLRDKVASYYAKNGKIPASIQYTDIASIKAAGVISDTIDTGKFLVIDLSAIDNLTLNYGKDFEKVKTDSGNVNNYKDLYIINETSHNIFYVEGITVDDETFYTDYTADDVDSKAVDLKYVDNVKIPEGFYYVDGTKDTGIVISDEPGDDLENSKHGNQFVWVPVENMNDFHTIEGYTSGELQNMLDNCAEPYMDGDATEVAEYESMTESVKANKGFYIGRFAAGKDSSENVIVQKNVNVYNNVSWGNSMTDATGGAVEKAKKFANENASYNNSVTSTLCYGVQWDATLKFIDSDYVGFAKDSSQQGWYSDNYDNTETGNTETNPNRITGLDLIYSNSSNIVANRQKNIYDMAGSVCEWTMEVYNNMDRVVRGGDNGREANKNPASYRGHFLPNQQEPYIGFRIALYLNDIEEENWSPVYDKKGSYKDKNGDTAYIPQGFQVSRKNGENTIDDGLVVRDLNKNEFVWVPVENMEDFVRIAGYSNGSLQSYDLENYIEPFASGYSTENSTEQSEYNAMKNSVQINHGFYIGRFEAGKDESGNVVVKKGVNVYNNVPWGNAMNDIEGISNTSGKVGAVKLSKEFATNNNYQGLTSNLCYSVQWDAIMQFMDSNYISGTCKADSYVRNSNKKGWYSDNYNKTDSGNTETNPNHLTGIDLIYEENPRIIANRQKNIYDMAGNVWEWSMETYQTTKRIARGSSYGSYGNDYCASSRSGACLPESFNEGLGFRIALYLKD